ncbi:MAG: DMT family transporter [Xanthobacteraceae bacterium]
MPSSSRTLLARLFDQPYLLLILTMIFWAGNAIVGRYVAGDIPPVTLAFIRWTGATMLIMPFAWRYLKRDWPVIRKNLGVLLMISIAGVGAFNTLQYTALEYTQAINVVLLLAAGPLFIAMWSLILLGVRLTWMQAAGIALSMLGVLVILLRGDLGELAHIRFNTGDLLIIVALAIFGYYSVMVLKRPEIHGLSFLAFTFCCGALSLVPLLMLELWLRPVMAVTLPNLLALAYVVVFPSTLAYPCYNRAVELIGANRSAPFGHLVPLFGTVLAIVLLGERMHLFHVIGFVLVLSGIYIAARKPRNASVSDSK